MDAGTDRVRSDTPDSLEEFDAPDAEFVTHSLPIIEISHSPVTLSDPHSAMDGGDGGESLMDRVHCLEKKISSQDDEIVCLKSALSDALRRLSVLESVKTNNIPASRPSGKLTAARSPVVESSARPSHLTANSAQKTPAGSRNKTPTANRVHGQPSPSPQGGQMKKWGSVPGTVIPEKVNGTQSPRSSISEETQSNKSAASSVTNLNSVTSTSDTKTPQSGRDVTRQGSQNDSARRGGSRSNLSSNPSKPSTNVISNFRQREASYNSAEGCIKFYLRGRALNFYAPKALIDSLTTTEPHPPPKAKLSIEWVYGYRGKDARSNIYLLPTGEILYFVAAVAILYNPEEQTQRHYIGHTDDIKCMAVHPDKVTVATGQVAGHDKKDVKIGIRRRNTDAPVVFSELWPHIRIWNSISLATLKIIGIGDFERAVSCLSFSKVDGGQYLVVADEANEHIVSLWDWQKGDKGHKVTEMKSSTEPVISIEFHPCEPNSFVSCGKNQLCFWTIEGTTFTRKMGIFEKYEKPKFVTCIAFSESGDVITGDSNGNLFVWARGTTKISHAECGVHEGGIFSVCTLRDGSTLTGGKDRRIVKWDSAYKKTGEEFEIPDTYGPVRMLTQGKGSLVLVGTTKNCILQGSLDLKFSPIVQGHTDELWGITALTNQSQFLTVGYDKNLYLWDTLTHTPVWSKELPDSCHSLAVHPEGQLVAVGSCSSRWYVLDLTSRELITSHSDASEQIECMEYSPDGQFFACGSRDNNIYIYAVSESGRKYNKLEKCTGHSSFITHLDWSVDSQYLQSNSGDYELLFWNRSSGRQITSPSSMRDVDWATQNCTLSFSACGIWPEGADGTDVNAVTRSNQHHLLASADDFGKVNLFGYPCHQPKSEGSSYLGHSSHVTNVRFLHDDSRLISTGGKDTSVIQWQVVEVE